jgi:hypothetical protein
MMSGLDAGRRWESPKCFIRKTLKLQGKEPADQHLMDWAGYLNTAGPGNERVKAAAAHFIQASSANKLPENFLAQLASVGSMDGL